MFVTFGLLEKPMRLRLVHSADESITSKSFPAKKIPKNSPYVI